MSIDRMNFDIITQKDVKAACLVVGDIILDKYIIGEVKRISPEAPIPVLNANTEKYVLGGAANVAGNIAGYYVDTYLCGTVGDDVNGKIVVDMLQEKGIKFIGEKNLNRVTTLKSRIVAMNQQLVRVDHEDSTAIEKVIEEKLLSQINSIITKVQCVVISDYNKGVCTDSFCKRLIIMCIDRNVSVVVDPKSANWNKYMGADLITPNFKEYKEAAGCDLDNTEENILKYSDKLFDKYNLKNLLITRSALGMTLIKKNKDISTIQAVSQEVYDVSGAGDTVIGTIAALLSKGVSLEAAVEVSNYAAGLSISKAGTYMVTADEVVEYMNRKNVSYYLKIVDWDEVKSLIRDWKKSREIIVFSNGCFDILHVGHIQYLNEAKKYGSKMIIGLNSDASVKRLKGSTRPINSEKNRAEMLAALQCVDAVVIFDEDTPESLIKMVEPDYLIKGGDYKIEEIVGRQYAKVVKTIPLTEGFSTTSIIEKMSRA